MVIMENGSWNGDAEQEVNVLMQRLSTLMYLLVKREGQVPLRGGEREHLESVLAPLGVEIAQVG